MIAICLALVIDISWSVSPENYRLQTEATAAALETPQVAHAAELGLSTAVIFFADDATVVVPPTRDPRAAAAALRATERPGGASTNVADGVRLGVETVLQQDCGRRVVDVSGDGPDNTGPLRRVTEVAQAAANAEVFINALPIILDGQNQGDLETWYRENLTDPTGGFTLPATWESFPAAIRRKIASEIALN